MNTFSRRFLGLWLASGLIAGCSSPRETPARQAAHDDGAPATSPRVATPTQDATAMTTPLPDALESELSAIRNDPAESVGFGLKAYAPYEPNTGHGLMTGGGPEVTQRLNEEARGTGDRVYRLAILHVLGKRADAEVDAALIGALDDPELRATAAYLLGRPGSKGYPSRTRDVAAVRAALRVHLADASTFDDPFYRRSFRTQDFVLGAFVRVVGTEHFRFPDPDLADLVGLSLPELTDAARADLLAQAEQAR